MIIEMIIIKKNVNKSNYNNNHIYNVTFIMIIGVVVFTHYY